MLVWVALKLRSGQRRRSPCPIRKAPLASRVILSIRCSFRFLSHSSLPRSFATWPIGKHQMPRGPPRQFGCWVRVSLWLRSLLLWVLRMSLANPAFESSMTFGGMHWRICGDGHSSLTREVRLPGDAAFLVPCELFCAVSSPAPQGSVQRIVAVQIRLVKGAPDVRFESRHLHCKTACPLYTRKRTCAVH